ncbi:hypothetical protein HPP92_018112 [Vanilla planifolia]|uniref:Uncharacterized protein n=1 Tax=Vanilla planifolia TaxID=51239 RepID=A0A835QAI4_VANPL|nr:hypothetical protein HPP92_018701 [Vanilla planifolia]KAG0468784.1 hypothetical protein HPP92_018112 [Vanilla planifolia]
MLFDKEIIMAADSKSHDNSIGITYNVWDKEAACLCSGRFKEEQRDKRSQERIDDRVGFGWRNTLEKEVQRELTFNIFISICITLVKKSKEKSTEPCFFQDLKMAKKQQKKAWWWPSVLLLLFSGSLALRSQIAQAKRPLAFPVYETESQKSSKLEEYRHLIADTLYSLVEPGTQPLSLASI